MIEDQEFYGWAMREIAERKYSETLMAKAYALSDGDPEKTKATYIRLRVPQLKEEAAAIILDRLTREKAKADSKRAANEAAERQRQLEAIEIKKRQAEEKKQAEERAKAEQKRLQDLESQRAGEAWGQSESKFRIGDPWIISSQNAGEKETKSETQSPKEDSAPLSPEEREKLIKILKESQTNKFKLF